MLFSFAQAGFSQVQINWNGDYSNQWDFHLNWTPNIVPNGGVYVVIESNDNDVYPILFGDYAINGIGIFSSASLTISPNASLTTKDVFFLGGESTGFYNDGFVTNHGTLNIGTDSPSSGDRALWNNGDFTNGQSGTININKAEEYGILSLSYFLNQGDIVIGDESSPNMDTGLGVIASSSFTNQSTGSIEINRSIDEAILISQGTLTNLGSIDIGNSHATGAKGIFVSSGSLDNESGASITIEDVSSIGIDNDGIFNNKSTISFALPSGTNSLKNSGTFSNSTSSSLLSFNSSVSTTELNNTGTFYNYGDIDIGQTTSPGMSGLDSSGPFTNYSSGTIKIDRASNYGLRTYSTFTNNGNLYIGDAVTNGNYGIENKGNFINSAGDVRINRSTLLAFENGAFGDFTNTSNATFKIGSAHASGTVGIVNYNDITVNSGTVEINRVSGVGISNLASGEFVTSSTGTTKIGNISISASNGIENHGDFTTTGASASLEINRVSNIGILNLETGEFTNAASAITNIGNLTGTRPYGIVNDGTFTSTGSGSDLFINRANISSIFNQSTATFTNSSGSDLRIGNITSTGEVGIINDGAFTNTGTSSVLEINRITEAGIQHQDGSFKNLSSGEIYIGNIAGTFTNGINSTDNLQIGADATVHINKYTNTGYSNQSGGHLNCDGHLTIGNTYNSGDYGIVNNGTVALDQFGTITIDNTDLNAIRNQTGANFTISGDMNLGDDASIGEYGIYNFGTFKSTSILSSTKINRASINGFYNSATWNSGGFLNVGTEGNDAEVGVFNSGNLNVTQGSINVNRCSEIGIENTGTITCDFFGGFKIGEFASVGLRGLVNTGTMTTSAGSFSINNSTITGLLNQGTFTNTNNFNIGTTTSTGQYGIVNESIMNCNGVTVNNATTAGMLNTGSAVFRLEGGTYNDLSN